MNQQCIVCEFIDDTKNMQTDGAEWYCQPCWENYLPEILKHNPNFRGE